jgi:WD40 repeat protein
MTVAMTRDGRTLAAATADGAIRFADVGRGRPRGPPTFAHAGAVVALAFSPDGRWLATSGKDSALYLWNVARQRPVSLYRSLTAPATSLSVSPDGTILAATIVREDGSGELDVFQIPRLKALARVPARAGTQIQFSRDGQRVFFGDDSGIVWTLDTHTWRPRGAPLGVQSGGSGVGQRPNPLSDPRKSDDHHVRARRGGPAPLTGDPARLPRRPPAAQQGHALPGRPADRRGARGGDATRP